MLIEGRTVTMQVRETEDFNFGGGGYPGYRFCPPAQEAPSPMDLDSRYDYYYETEPWWLTGQLYYRPYDSIAIVDDDAAPAVERWVTGWTSANDWFRYSFDVPTDGWVKLVLRAATPAPSAVRFYWDEEFAGSVICQSSDGNVYEDFALADAFRTTAGRHTLRLVVETGGVNLDLLGHCQRSERGARARIHDRSDDR